MDRVDCLRMACGCSFKIHQAKQNHDWPQTLIEGIKIIINNLPKIYNQLHRTNKITENYVMRGKV